MLDALLYPLLDTIGALAVLASIAAKILPLKRTVHSCIRRFR